MSVIQAEEKKRADKILTEKEKRVDEIQMAKVKADKELAIKQMELNAQPQASCSAAVDPPPLPAIEMLSPRSYQPSQMKKMN